MNDNRITVDTNILICAIDTRDPVKHEQAAEFVSTLVNYDTVIILQALTEFYSVATKNLKKSQKIITDQILDWQILFPVAAAKPSSLIKAMTLVEEHQFSFWDAMLCATAKEAGVTTLFSESFHTKSPTYGIEFVNPFDTIAA
jgi:predicted nucleic acid-binding protein